MDSLRLLRTGGGIPPVFARGLREAYRGSVADERDRRLGLLVSARADSNTRSSFKNLLDRSLGRRPTVICLLESVRNRGALLTRGVAA